MYKPVNAYGLFTQHQLCVDRTEPTCGFVAEFADEFNCTIMRFDLFVFSNTWKRIRERACARVRARLWCTHSAVESERFCAVPPARALLFARDLLQSVWLSLIFPFCRSVFMHFLILIISNHICWWIGGKELFQSCQREWIGYRSTCMQFLNESCFVRPVRALN